MNVQPMAFGVNQLNTSQMAKPQQTANNKEDSFSYTLEQSRGKNDKQEPTTKNKTVSRDGSTKKVEEFDKEAVSTDSKTEKTKETSQSEKTTSEDEVLVEEQDVEVIQAIADLLQIMPEELEQLLATLQIKISDLLEGDNLQKLIMQVHGVEEPMDLLSISEVSSQLKEITSIVEEYTAETVLAKPGESFFADTLEKTQLQQLEVKNEPAVKVENSDLKTNDQRQNVKLESDNETLGVKADNTSNISVEAPNNEELSQGEEQPSNSQTSLANEFIDNLSQSMGEIFQPQNAQVNEVGEAITGRNEFVSPRMVLDQLVEKIKVSSLNEETKMSIQLKPEHLGKVSMEIISKQGIMTAQFKVENDKTKEMIEQNMQSLRESLENKGLVIQELEVTVGQNQNEDRQTYKGPKPSENISDLIDSMMNEEIEEAARDHVVENDAGEVNFTA